MPKLEESGLDPRVVLDSLRGRGLLAPGENLVEVADLSPGFGTARVFRMEIGRPAAPGLGDEPGSVARESGAGRALILKILDWRKRTRLAPRDPNWLLRERWFYESPIPSHFPDEIRIPGLLAVDIVDQRTWLWLEDLDACLRATWDTSSLLRAARQCALLHRAYLGHDQALDDVAWLRRGGYGVYGHHIPSCHANLDAAGRHSEWSTLFTEEEISELRRCLDAFPALNRQIRALPITLAHGDFHTPNMGTDGAQRLVLIDWAAVGIDALGTDIASLVSFSGGGSVLTSGIEGELLRAYADVIERLTSTDHLVAIIRASHLWHLTHGLHVRLHAGLGHLLANEVRNDRGMRVATDIKLGCERALEATRALAVP
jgi:hypothetical protein